MNDALYTQLDEIVDNLMDVFEIHTPPVPIETMLNSPRNAMWKEVNVAQLTGSFLTFTDQYSPRMSMARLLARHVINCDWGKEQNLPAMVDDDATLRVFARMLIMPAGMLKVTSRASRTPSTISMQFEVPEEDAHKRLLQLYG